PWIPPFWMGTDVSEPATLPYPSAIKVHRLMCLELMKLVERISMVFPEIEAARPRCSSGIEVLCSLSLALDKAKSLLQQCSESSKLYLAMTGDAILSRCERLRASLERSLSQIQSMVPVALAVEISGIINDLRSATFSLESSEEEAGKVLRSLLGDASASDPVESSLIESLRFAAVRLQITSSKDLVTEKRSIKKLIDKVHDSDQKKKKILRYLLYLLKKYDVPAEQTENGHENSVLFGNSYISAYRQSEVKTRSRFAQDEAKTDTLSKSVPPEEFVCPISMKLMYDPVVITSGQTFERIWIQKWLDEGHDTCPKTKIKLADQSLTPNTAMKDLISKWCRDHGVPISDPSIKPARLEPWENSSTSISSLGSSLNDIRLHFDVSSVSLGSLDTSYGSDSLRVKTMVSSGLIPVKTTDSSNGHQSYSEIPETGPALLSGLEALPWDSQCKAVEDVMNHLYYNDDACQSMSLENFVEPLLQFLRDACNPDRHDLKAQKTGVQLLLAFLYKSRSGVSFLDDGAFSLFASFLDSELLEEALGIMELLSSHWYCRHKIAASGALTSILKIIDTQTIKFQEPAIKVLGNMSLSSEICPAIVALDCIPKLVPLLGDDCLAAYCIDVLKNLCGIEEARVSIAETSGCVASIAELLDNDSQEVQEHALAVLLSLCSQRVQYCQLVMEEGLNVIPSLVMISSNGNDTGKASAVELLRLLRNVDFKDFQVTPSTGVVALRDSCEFPDDKRPSSKPSGFFGKLLPFSRKK
ncbi:U-box domain, partial [Dillenia turbinata]